MRDHVQSNALKNLTVYFITQQYVTVAQKPPNRVTATINKMFSATFTNFDFKWKHSKVSLRLMLWTFYTKSKESKKIWCNFSNNSLKDNENESFLRCYHHRESLLVWLWVQNVMKLLLFADQWVFF